MDYINEFIKFNPSIGGHFKKHQENHDNDFIETNFNDEFENDENVQIPLNWKERERFGALNSYDSSNF